MTGLENQDTGIVEDVPDDDVSDSISSGTHAPSGPMNLIEPTTGKSFNVLDPQKARDLIDIGWKPETKEQLMDRTAAAVVKENPVTSSVAALTGQFTNQALLGIPQVVRENTGSEDDENVARATDKAIEEEHPVLNIAGGALGMATTLLTTPVGKLLGYFGDAAAGAVEKAASIGGQTVAKSAVTTLVKQSAKLGVENAALNLPYRVTEDALGDPNVASEGILSHMGEDLKLGAEFGLGASLIGPVLKTAAGVAGGVISPEWLKNQANTFQLKNAGALTTEFKKLGDITGKAFTPEQTQETVNLLDKYTDPLTQFMGPSAIYNKMVAAKQSAGQALEAIRAKADELVPDSISYPQLSNALDSVEKEYSKGNLKASLLQPDLTGTGQMDAATFQSNVQQYGPDPSKWPTGQANVPVNAVDPRTTQDLKQIAMVKSSLESEAITKMRAAGATDEQIAEALQTGKGFPNFSIQDAHALRQSVKDMLFNEEKIYGIKTDGGLDAWKAIGGIMDNNINQIAAITNNPDLKNAFKAANQNYSKITQFTDHVFKSAAARAVSRNRVGLTTNIFTAAGAVAAGDIGALGGFAGGFLKQHFGNYIMYRTLGTAASALDAVSGKIDTSISKFLASDVGEKTTLGSVSVFSRYFKDDKIDKQSGFQKFQNDLNLAAANPESVSDSLNSFIPDATQFLPQNYSLMGAVTQNAIKYLQTMAPQPPSPIYSGGPSRPWQPSDNDLSKYSRRIEAVFNPLSVLDEIRTGTLTQEAVDAVKNVYPNFFGAIQQKIAEKLSAAPASQVYRIRQKLSLILPSTEDPTARATRIQGLQAGFASNNNFVKPRANSKIDAASRATTDINRITNE